MLYFVHYYALSLPLDRVLMTLSPLLVPQGGHFPLAAPAIPAIMPSAIPTQGPLAGSLTST